MQRGEAKFTTGHESVVWLRERATNCAIVLDRGLMTFKTQKARAEYEARFAGLCEAIEFITYNGSSFRERQEAFDRARAERGKS